MIDPPELGILERDVKRVKQGRAVVLPLSPETVGHGSHTKAALWQQSLKDVLENSPQR